MTEGDLLVRGGTVVDGTGAPATRADVRVRAGRIAEVGVGLAPDGEPELDAAGAVVAPGFIEIHTHYDGAVWWDPSCDPMPAHGTTSMVIGNCGLSLAPLTAPTRAAMYDLFCFIEDLPTPAFVDNIPDRWSTWREYRDVAAGHPTAVNLAGWFSHHGLRVVAMGEAAWERAATDDELAVMCALLDDALTAGALGLATSVMDTDRDRRPVPGCIADDRELDALLSVVGRHGAGFQFVPRFLQPEHHLHDVDRLARLCGAHGVRVNWAGLMTTMSRTEQRRAALDHHEELLAAGIDVGIQYSGRPSHTFLNLDRSIMFTGVPAWHELLNGPHEDQERLLADEAWRARARADWDACTYTLAPISRPGGILCADSERRLPGETGISLDELATRDGSHPSDAMADWYLRNGRRSSMRTAPNPVDEDDVVRLARMPSSVAGASDAGAHLQMFNGAGDATYLLLHYVRDRGLLSLEEAVHAVTGKHAEFFGLGDRGRLTPGAAGDLVVFELDRLQAGEEYRVDDVPAPGGWRYGRTGGGYRATVVAGVPTCVEDRGTGALPGRFLTRG